MPRIKLLSIVIALLVCSCRDEKLVTSEVPECFPFSETCNGIDDDCDGTVDNIVQIPTPCYPGDQNDLLHGECSYGKISCILGREMCVGYTTPDFELCDGKDNDCNGQIDEHSQGFVDMVIAIDYSGSMGSPISTSGPVTRLQHVNSEITAWVTTQIGRPDIRLALVGIPDALPMHDGYTTVLKNLGDPAGIIPVLAANSLATGGGNEVAIDAIVLIASSANPLQLNWSPLAQRAVVIITDELPQSASFPILTERQAKVAALSAGLRVFVFSSVSDWRSWNPYPLELASPSYSISSQLEQIAIQGKCQ